MLVAHYCVTAAHNKLAALIAMHVYRLTRLILKERPMTTDSNNPFALSRRQFLQSSATLAGVSTFIGCAVTPTLAAEEDYVLTVMPSPITLIPNTFTPAWTFNGQFPAPIVRVKQNRPVRIRVVNQLQEPTTIHWHGIRLNNAADGVPFLTQPPIQPGQSFLYEFNCPDAGTFWYHPHMNSLAQLSRGLVGLIIVEEEHPVNFDADLPLILKDWHLNDDGSFAPFSDPRAAARTGTLGNFATINGLQNAHFPLPAGGVARVRLANVDNTRVFNIGSTANAQVIAIDGNPVAKPYPLTQHGLGAGMRLDLAVTMPKEIGSKVTLTDQKGRFSFDMCTLEAVATDAKVLDTPPRLPMNPIDDPDLDNAMHVPLVFEWAGALTPNYGDPHAKSVFWTINKRAWEGAGPTSLPEPLVTIPLGRSVIFELHNATPHHHPIHLHGHTFTVLSSDQKSIIPFHTDTVLMSKYERVKVAIVADNPGDWMLHCHVIEHMKTGLMGFIRVQA